MTQIKSPYLHLKQKGFSDQVKEWMISLRHQLRLIIKHFHSAGMTSGHILHMSSTCKGCTQHLAATPVWTANIIATTLAVTLLIFWPVCSLGIRPSGGLPRHPSVKQECITHCNNLGYFAKQWRVLWANTAQCREDYLFTANESPLPVSFQTYVFSPGCMAGKWPVPWGGDWGKVRSNGRGDSTETPVRTPGVFRRTTRGESETLLSSPLLRQVNSPVCSNCSVDVTLHKAVIKLITYHPNISDYTRKRSQSDIL